MSDPENLVNAPEYHQLHPHPRGWHPGIPCRQCLKTRGTSDEHRVQGLFEGFEALKMLQQLKNPMVQVRWLYHGFSERSQDSAKSAAKLQISSDVIFARRKLFGAYPLWRFLTYVNTQTHGGWASEIHRKRWLKTIPTVHRMTVMLSSRFLRISMEFITFCWLKKCHKYKLSTSHHHFYRCYKLTIPGHGWFTFHCFTHMNNHPSTINK